jgi:two-component system OmpR family response regulator
MRVAEFAFPDDIGVASPISGRPECDASENTDGIMLDLIQASSVSATTGQSPIRILLVEDDAEIAQMLGETLAENGFAVRFAGSAQEMDLGLQQGETDLVILDVMLPGESGISICRRLRSTTDLPIIMLTALGEHYDRILGLELGADDYVTKPFHSRELIARIRAVMRRVRKPDPAGGVRPRVFKFSGWQLNATKRELYNADGVRVTTTSAEFDLLEAFCQKPGQVLSRDQLLELTRGGLAGPVERSIDVHISRIRQKVEPNPREPSLIKTVRLGGYLFTPAVEAL